MAVSLSKGGNVSLSKEAPGLTSIVVGLGWDPRATDGQAFDLDGSVFLLNAGGKVRGDSDFIFYNNKTSSDGSVEHTGDNTTGAGEGDDEPPVANQQRHEPQPQRHRERQLAQRIGLDRELRDGDDRETHLAGERELRLLHALGKCGV